jgi:hypothetical protein
MGAQRHKQYVSNSRFTRLAIERYFYRSGARALQAWHVNMIAERKVTKLTAENAAVCT